MSGWRAVSGWRTALRIAAREARRAKGRAALVAAMILLPVTALAFVAVSYDTFTLTPDERADRLMGSTQAVLAWFDAGPVHQAPDDLVVVAVDTPTPPADPSADRLLALLPAGSAVLADQQGSLLVRTAAGTGAVPARLLDYTNVLARGIYRPLSGQTPASADEVALTPAASRRTGAGVGGTVALADGSRTFRVTAIVEDPGNLNEPTIVLRPGALSPDTLSGDPTQRRWLVTTPGPLTWAQVRELNTHGVAAVSRYVLAHPPGEADQYREFGTGGTGASVGVFVLIVGLATLEVVLLAGPAFAVGARRRRRDLALVAASGGTPAHLRRIVLADGVVLGALAAVTGLALGTVAALATVPVIENASQVRAGSIRVFPAALAAIAVLAVLTGLLAALVPAWVAARQDVVAALAGRRGVTRSRRRWVVLGLALTAAGAAGAAIGAWRVNTPAILAGLVAAELGVVLCTSAIVALVARLGRWLPLAPRIALRDISRNRTAAAPAVSAVMAAVVGSLAVGVVLVANDARARDTYRVSGRPGDVVLFRAGTGPQGDHSIPPDAVAALRAGLPVTSVHVISLPTCAGGDCFVVAQLPAARDCPYSRFALNHEPTPAQQRAARADPRCPERAYQYRYFDAIQSDLPGGLTVVVDPDSVSALVDLPAADTAAATRALRDGAVVVSDPRYLVDGRVTLVLSQAGAGRGGEPVTVTGAGVALAHPPPVPVTMMTEATARSLGLGAAPFALVASTDATPTVAAQDRLRAALGDGYRVYVERGYQPNTLALLVLALVAGVIALGATAIATGLAAADGRADLTTLAAVGASPRVRRVLSLSQAGVIAGLGSLLGVLAGLGAAVAVLVALNQRYAALWPAPIPYPIRVPWLNVAVALLVVPLVAMLGAGLLTRSRLPVERRL